MLCKEIDDKSDEIKQLESLLQLSANKKQKQSIETDLKLLKNGYKSEKENAYYLDFEFKNSKNYFLLHDIRLEHNGRSAQIDHILINRFEIEILESKSFTGVLTINNDGSMSVKYGNMTKTFPNPIEQNNRHAKVLNEFLKDQDVLPSNIKLFGGISIIPKILISPKTTITNKILPNGFERADSFVTNKFLEIDNMSTISVLKTAGKFMTINKAENIANILVKNHKPIKFDYTNKYYVKKNNTKTIANKPIQAFIKEAVLDKKLSICNEIHKDISLCSKCKSPNIEIRSGKYGYYFKCLFCNANTSIKLTCTTDKCKPKLKKRKLEFYRVCEVCEKDEIFFTNKNKSNI